MSASTTNHDRDATPIPPRHDDDGVPPSLLASVNSAACPLSDTKNQQDQQDSNKKQRKGLCLVDSNLDCKPSAKPSPPPKKKAKTTTKDAPIQDVCMHPAARTQVDMSQLTQSPSSDAFFLKLPDSLAGSNHFNPSSPRTQPPNPPRSPSSSPPGSPLNPIEIVEDPSIGNPVVLLDGKPHIYIDGEAFPKDIIDALDDTASAVRMLPNGRASPIYRQNETRQ